MYQPSFETIALAVLVVCVVVLAAHQVMLHRQLRRIFGNGAHDVGEAIDAHIRAVKKMGAVIKKQHEEITQIQTNFLSAVQKVHMLRFSSFEEGGAHQSFSIALLDGNDNGVVLTSLHMRDSVRLYAKPVERGVSKYPLSQEEEKTLAHAKQTSS
ncbi:MAG: DUF4446 family protein [Patescibacteria group bacterium]